MRFFVSSANSSVSSDSGKDGKPSLNGSGQGHSLQSSLSGLPNLTPSKTRKSCKYMYLAIENKQKFEVFNIHETLHKIQSMGVKKLGQNQFSKKKLIWLYIVLTAIHKLSSTFVHWIGQIGKFMEIGIFFIPCHWPNGMAFFFVSLNNMHLLFLLCFYSENFRTQRKVSNFNFHSLYLWDSSILKFFLVQILCLELVLYL